MKTKIGVPLVPPAAARPQDSGVQVVASVPDDGSTMAVSPTLGTEPLEARGSEREQGTDTRPARRLNHSTLELGLVLGETYQLRETLGRGGMGAVYAAIDLNLNRHVAIKVPSTREAAEMMRQEAQALAAFSHRGLPAVYALDTHEDWPFIVMERIYGRTLEAAIEEASASGGMPVNRALHWTLELIDVLQVLHRANLAHRDLKPDNVMLAPGDRLVLLDLGIVRQERFIGREQTISGSPHYIAPETVRGSVRPGEAHLVDIYALGITAYQMLTGRLPFDADSPLTVMHMHMSQPVPRVSATRQVPALLDDIVFEMMSKAPFERPASIDLGGRSLPPSEGRPYRDTSRSVTPGKRRLESASRRLPFFFGVSPSYRRRVPRTLRDTSHVRHCTQSRASRGRLGTLRDRPHDVRTHRVVCASFRPVPLLEHPWPPRQRIG